MSVLLLVFFVILFGDGGDIPLFKLQSRVEDFIEDIVGFLILHFI